jgi:thiol:disulfide interchange protein DsbA
MKFTASCLRVATWLLAIVLSSAASAQLAPGKDFRAITPPQPTESGKRVEVLEFFSYGCPHCKALQPPLKVWLKRKPADVEFKRVPVVFENAMLPFAQAYYALESTGIVDRLHDDVFAAIHEQKQRLMDPQVLFDWVAKHGIDRKKFADTYHSFGVKSRASRASEMTRNYDIQATPTLAVNGKYLLMSPTTKRDGTADYDRYFQVLDQVIAMARKERAGK